MPHCFFCRLRRVKIILNLLLHGLVKPVIDSLGSQPPGFIHHKPFRIFPIGFMLHQEELPAVYDYAVKSVPAPFFPLDVETRSTERHRRSGRTWPDKPGYGGKPFFLNIIGGHNAALIQHKHITDTD